MVSEGKLLLIGCGRYFWASRISAADNFGAGGGGGGGGGGVGVGRAPFGITLGREFGRALGRAFEAGGITGGANC